MGTLDDIDRRREEVARDRENSARLAHSYATFVTTGIGSIQYAKRVKFGLTFIERPIVSYAAQFDIDELADLLDIENADDIDLPMCSGFVVNWEQDERDFYTGCWVAVRIDADPVPMEIEHHFTFAAIGLKDIPPDATDATE